VLLDEQNDGHQQQATSVSHDVLVERLSHKGIEHIATRSRSVLSKYFDRVDKQPIFVVASSSSKPVPLEEYTPLYERYRKPATMRRLFVDPDKRHEARALLKSLIDEESTGREVKPASA
jgi:hypothetical protein